MTRFFLLSCSHPLEHRGLNYRSLNYDSLDYAIYIFYVLVSRR